MTKPTGKKVQDAIDMSAKDMNDEAKQFLRTARKDGLDAANRELQAKALDDFTTQLAAADEKQYQDLVIACGGNYEQLSRALFSALKGMQRELANQNQSKKAGRPSNSWGPDGAAKFIVKQLVDEAKKEMEARGNKNVTTRDAVIHAYGIDAEKANRLDEKRRIDDLCRSYTEADSMLKK